MFKLETTILLAGNSTRFIRTSPDPANALHKSLCLINDTTLIRDLFTKITKFFNCELNINIVINDESCSELRNEVELICKEYSAKNLFNEARVLVVPYLETNIYSVLASLESFSNKSENKPQLIIDGDTFISSSAARYIYDCIKDANGRGFNLLFGSRVKNYRGEWGLVAANNGRYSRLTNIDENPHNTDNLITTGISFIYSKNLKQYLRDRLNATPRTKYWDEFYKQNRPTSPEVYVTDLGDRLVYEVDTYYDYTDLLEKLYKRGIDSEYIGNRTLHFRSKSKN